MIIDSLYKNILINDYIRDQLKDGTALTTALLEAYANLLKN